MTKIAKSAKFIFKFAVASFMIVTKASAAIFAPWANTPQNDQSAVWQSVRNQLALPKAEISLSPKFVDLIQNTDFSKHLAETVRLSYSMVSGSQIGELDKIWLDALMAQASSSEVATYLEVRAELANSIAGDRDTYLEEWLWQANAGPDSGKDS